MSTIEVGSIEPTTENAKIVQQLTHDYYSAGNIDRVERYANPNNAMRVDFQRGWLEADPDSYTGVFVHDTLAGIIKTKAWTERDELEFTPNADKTRVEMMVAAGMDILGKEKLSIATFAVNKEVAGEYYEESAEHLLDIVTDKAVKRGQAAINSSFYEADLLWPIARQNGFDFTGRMTIVPAHRGALKRLYTKPLDY